ncbi:MAG: DNA-3-methyladenine glycosylase [Planctomycetota bacterium]
MPIAAQHIKAARLHLQKNDAVMKRIIKAVGPCTLKTRSDRFRTLVNSIVSQQISGAAARTILRRLADASRQYGGVSPEGLSAFDVESLRELGVSRQKAGYILDLTDKVHSGEVELRQMGRRSNEEVIEQLTKIKGIGVWTAQMFLMFSLGRLDVFPADDLGVQNAIKNAYPVRGELTRPKMLKLADSWHPYETIAAWYLWRSLEVELPMAKK